MNTSLIPVDYLFNSSDRTTGTLDQPVFQLPLALENVESMAVTYVQVPFTFYTFLPRRQFIINDNVTTSTCTIEPGTYNPTTFPRAVFRAIQLQNAGFANHLTLYIEAVSGLLVIYRNNNTPFEVRYNQGASEMGRLMGFNESFGAYTIPAIDATTTPLVDNSGNIITTGWYVKMSFPPIYNAGGQLYLQSNLASAVFGSVRTSQPQSSTLAFFPMNQPVTNFGSEILYEPQDPAVLKATEHSISRVSFALRLDTTYGDITLNGRPYQVGVRFFVRNATAVDHYTSTQR